MMVLSAMAGFRPPFPARAQECGAFEDRGFAMFGDLQEQEVTLLNHLEATSTRWMRSVPGLHQGFESDLPGRLAYGQAV